MDNETTPKIKKLSDVGEAPFQFIEKTESILQGWDSKIKKTIYLFKTDTGFWGYFDKDSSQVIAVNSWKEKAAWIGDHWVKMSLYHRIKIIFNEPITYGSWDKISKKEIKMETKEAIVVVTDTTYKQLLEQLNGREETSVLKFHFTTRKIQNRQATYVDKVLWVS